jgi:hypothetical protein
VVALARVESHDGPVVVGADRPAALADSGSARRTDPVLVESSSLGHSRITQRIAAVRSAHPTSTAATATTTA